MLLFYKNRLFQFTPITTAKLLTSTLPINKYLHIVIVKTYQIYPDISDTKFGDTTNVILLAIGTLSKQESKIAKIAL